MNTPITLKGLGTSLYWFSIAVFVGTIVELALTKHWEQPVQLIPFAVCIVGAAVVTIARYRPGRGSLLAARVVMALVAASSLVGAWFHLQNNLHSVLERQPETGGLALVLAVLTGRAPAGAVGILAVGAVLAILSLEATAAARANRDPEREPRTRPARLVPSASNA